MTTFIEPSELSLLDKDMPPSSSLFLSVVFGACIGGMYLYDLYKKSKEIESSVKELEHEVCEVETLQQTHSDILQEHEQRIREKKNYDESEEIEEGKVQAWKGEEENNLCTIQIWREKISTYKKNQEWLSWQECEDASTTVRDFYLGNSNPDFQWSNMNSQTFVSGYVSETMVNGWDSIIKCKIMITFPSEEHLINYAGSSSYNAALKKMIDTKSIRWTRCLMDV